MYIPFLFSFTIGRYTVGGGRGGTDTLLIGKKYAGLDITNTLH